MCTVYDQIHEAWVEGRLIALGSLERHLDRCSMCLDTLVLVCPDVILLVKAKQFEISLVFYEVITAHLQKCPDCEDSWRNPPPCPGRWPD